MRICFIADSSSIHVQRIVKGHVLAGDEILILSSGVRRFDIPGVMTRHLLNPKKEMAGRSAEAKKSILAACKSLLPARLRGSLKRIVRNVRLFVSRDLCRKAILDFNADLVYCFRTFPEGMIASFSHVRPLLLRTAGADISKFATYPGYRQLIRKALCAADIVVTESFWEKKLLLALCGKTINAQVSIIGVDTNIFKPTSSKQRLRNKYELSPDAFVVVSNRYLNGDYNGWRVVRSIQAILQDCPDLVLLYVSPLAVDQHTKAKIQRICSQFPQIRFIDGGLPHSQVAEILSSGDVYISLSSVDGISNSVLEAMACGCVPIVADLPQIREWIEPGETGFIVPQENIQGPSELIKSLYRNPGALTELRARCASKIHREGQVEICMERTRSMLQTLVRSTRTSSSNGARHEQTVF
jgi:glycosyltransferase involved in cell wall biosynthesis